jgi:hypothetical protein
MVQKQITYYTYLDGFKKTRRSSKTYCLFRIKERTVKELTNFVLTGVYLHKTSIMWKILNFKVKPGRSYNDPLLLALESNINLEIED